MKYIAIIFLIFFFIKSYFYAKFEIKEKKNYPGGITILILSVIGLIFPLILLFTIY